jgi:hypothetical protein
VSDFLTGMRISGSISSPRKEIAMQLTKEFLSTIGKEKFIKAIGRKKEINNENL